MNCGAFSYSDKRCCKTPSVATRSGLLTSQKGHLEDIMAESDTSNQNQVKRKRNKHAFPTHFRTCSCTLKKRGNPSSLQLWMMNTPYTGEKYIRNIYGGLTRQKRSKEMVSSHKSLGVSEQKTTSELCICMYVCMYVHMSGEWRSGTGRQRAGRYRQRAERALSPAELELGWELLK